MRKALIGKPVCSLSNRPRRTIDTGLVDVLEFDRGVPVHVVAARRGHMIRRFCCGTTPSALAKPTPALPTSSGASPRQSRSLEIGIGSKVRSNSLFVLATAETKLLI